MSIVCYNYFMTKINSEKSDSEKADVEKSTSENFTPDVTTGRHAGRYLIIGITITIFNFGLYSVLANLIINNNNLLWLSTLISTLASTILAYILHSKITWKERPLTKIAIYKFFIWNLATAIFIGPFFTQLFSLITPLYDLAFNIFQSLNISFTYDFVQSTGAFVLTAIVTTILNFFFYDRFVFGKKKNVIK